MYVIRRGADVWEVLFSRFFHSNIDITQFKISSRKQGSYSESSRLDLSVKISGNNFALADAEGNSSGSLNRGEIADLILLRILLAICPKLW